MDLYRLGEGYMDAGLEELLDSPHGEDGRVVLVEWSEYLPDFLKPSDWLELELAESGQGRMARLAAHGPRSSEWLELSLSTFLQSGKS